MSVEESELPMSWGKIDDRLHSHPKVRAAGLEAMGLWVKALSYCCDHENDGRLTLDDVKMLVGGNATKARRLAGRLVDVGLWTRGEPSSNPQVGPELEQGSLEVFSFHDWSFYQRSRADLEALRSKKSESGRAGGIASGEARREASASSFASHKTNTRPVPSRPIEERDVGFADANPPAQPVEVVPVSLPSPTLPGNAAQMVPEQVALGLPESGVMRVADPKPSRKKPETDCPPVEATAEELAAWCTRWRLPQPGTNRELDKFVNHNRAKGTRYRDWHSAWLTWLSKAEEFASQRQAAQPAKTEPIPPPYWQPIKIPGGGRA